MTKDAKIEFLESANASLTKRVESLEEKVLLLLKQLEEKPVKKDSHNSHNPPSHDKSKPKRNKSLRKKTGLKPGGQKGHKAVSYTHLTLPTTPYV